MRISEKYCNELQQEYLQIFREALIPMVAGEDVPLILTHPAYHTQPLPSGANISSIKSPLLKEPQQSASYVRSATWPEQGFNASRFPLLLCVVEGEIDLRLGVTQHMVNQYSQLNKRRGIQVWRLPKGSICLIPPDVPYDDGDRPHWCGVDLSKAHSQLHWIQIVTIGALLHSCTTDGERHEIAPFLCIHDPRLVVLSEILCEALATNAPRVKEIAQANLATMLWRIEQGVLSSQLIDTLSGTGLEVPTAVSGQTAGEEVVTISNTAVERAHRFIQAHLHEPLKVEGIAAAAYGSPSWLNSQFQNEFGQSVMQYVTQCRLREARLLLADTDFPISEIGKLVGFHNPSYFCQVFTRWEKVAPAHFRKQHRNELS